MPRRSTPQAKTDDLAFPVRVKFLVPGQGLGRDYIRLHEWLLRALGAGSYAVHGAQTLGHDAIAVFFLELEAAQACIAAFPELEIADGTRLAFYSSPALGAGPRETEVFGVCNLYSMTRNQDAIRQLFLPLDDQTGNLPTLPGIYPDMEAPVVRNLAEGHELAMMRWGMPSPAFVLKGRRTDPGVTNIRNVSSPHWRRWLGVEHRCLVPFTSFSEYEMRNDGGREPVWFALDETRPLAFFAGIWTQWTSVRKLKEGEVTADLFGFLTCPPNAEVGAIHPKAMPVILTTPVEVEHWLTAPTAEALQLQRPLPDGALRIVARGEKQDGGPGQTGS